MFVSNMMNEELNALVKDLDEKNLIHFEFFHHKRIQK